MNVFPLKMFVVMLCITTGFVLPIVTEAQTFGNSWETPQFRMSSARKTADPLARPQTWSDENGKSSDELGLVSHKIRNFDLYVATSYIFDSNTYLTPNNEVSTSISMVEIGASYLNPVAPGRRIPYGIEYSGQYYFYGDDEVASRRDPYEQQLYGFVGLNGAKTAVKLQGSVSDNNANSVDFNNFDREIRRASSLDYEVGLTATRTLPHGTIEGGVGYAKRDFDHLRYGGINDYESIDGALFWFYNPSFAPRSQIGLGSSFGRDITDNNFNQTYYQPGIRYRYEVSPKTSIYGSLGYQIRSLGGGSRKRNHPVVYGIGANWEATDTTVVGIQASRAIRPSLVSFQENYESNGVAVNIDQALPCDMNLNLLAGYENSDYYATGFGPGSGREDAYYRYGASLSKNFYAFNWAGGATLFYSKNQNNSNQSYLDFDQHVVGVKVGFTY